MQTYYVPAEKCDMTPEQMIRRIAELHDICEQHDKGAQFWENKSMSYLSKVRDLEQRLAKQEAK